MMHSAKRDFGDPDGGSSWLVSALPSAWQPPSASAGNGPAAGSPALAIGYSVVVGWIFKYLIHALRGTLSPLSGAEAFSRFFGAAAASNIAMAAAGQRPDQSGPVPNRRGLGFIPWPNTSSAALRCRR